MSDEAEEVDTGTLAQWMAKPTSYDDYLGKEPSKCAGEFRAVAASFADSMFNFILVKWILTILFLGAGLVSPTITSGYFTPFFDEMDA